MKKYLLFLILLLIITVLLGCGNINEQNDGLNSLNTGITDADMGELTVIASNKISINVNSEENIYKNLSAVSTFQVQNVEIEADVPEFMTFDVTSNIFFNITSLTEIKADGVITLDVVYNDLADSNLSSCKVIAYMLNQDGLAGVSNPNNIIPLEIETVNVHPYQRLGKTHTEIKRWNAPFKEIVKETFVFKLKADFSNAFKQAYKGTLVLDFVRCDYEELIYLLESDGLYQINLDGSNKKLIRNDINNMDCSGMTFDDYSNSIYITHWNQKAQIKKIPLDPGQPVTIIKDGPSSLGGQGIALDRNEGRLFGGIYYSGLYSTTIDGSANWTQLVTSTQVSPGHGVYGQLVLDPENKHVYFRSPQNNDGNTEGRKIWRVNYDGSNLTMIYNCLYGHALGIDILDKKLYYSDLIGPDDILPFIMVRSDLDGSNIECLFKIEEPYEDIRYLYLDIKNRKMYFMVQDSNGGSPYKSKIMRANLDGSNIETIYSCPPYTQYSIQYLLHSNK